MASILLAFELIYFIKRSREVMKEINEALNS